MGAKNKQRSVKTAPAPQAAGSWLAGALGLGWIVLVAAANRDAVAGSLRALRTIGAFFGLFQSFEPGLFIGAVSAIGVVLAAFLIGRMALRACGLGRVGAGERFGFALAIGLGSLSLLLLAQGLIGHFKSTEVRMAFAMVFIAAAAGNAFLSRAPEEAPARTPGPKSPIEGLVACLLTALAALNFLGAAGPEVHYDALVYHLALPKLYLLNGRIFPTPYNIYSGIPLSAEMIYALGLALGGELAAKLIPWALGLSITAFVVSWVRERTDRPTALLAGLVFYSFPMVADSTWHCYVELPWCLYALAAVAALASTRDDEEPESKRLVLAGALAGFAVGTKYNAVVVPLIGLALLTTRAVRRGAGWRGLLRQGAVFSLAAAAAAAPWLLKNLAFYRNPVFPFFNESFAGSPRGIDWRGLMADAGSPNLREIFSSAAGIANWLSPFWPRVNTDGRMSLGYAFYLFLPWLILGRRGRGAFSDARITLAIAAGVWLLTTSLFRFALFVLPFAAVMIAVGLADWKAPPTAKKIASGVLILACALNGLQTLKLWQSYGNWRVVFGQVSRAEFLSHPEPVYPSPPYAGIAYVNEHLRPDAKVLFVHEARAFHSERDFIAASSFAQNPLFQLAEDSKSGDEIAEGLRRMGVTHILFNKAEMIRLGGERHLSKGAEAVLGDFWGKHLKSIYEFHNDDPRDTQWVGIFEYK